ncbi:phosphoribosylanthranilate isomerase [Arenimonas fontis]|uniref:phosphoribosylanthranilate isomerase n=1 Tax=Arenimonas fontis TaxID=2608255 RepID=UPI001FE85812|nr:phosphoribosylanthranilate isomerase [Arenimonas fontis]
MSRTRIKFCGLTRPGDVRLAVELGVDAIGFVFAAGSPRRLEPGQALALREAVPPPVAAVALFMDNPAEEVRRIVRALRPDLLQFHGGEDETFCRGFDRPYLKVLAMGQGGTEARQALARYPSASGFLLDGHAPGQRGGSGQAFDWSRAPAPGRPVWLAGGLGPDNVGRAIRAVRPYAVDVSSGIERAPGIKDGAKMQAFVEEVRRADRSGSE